MNAIVDIMAVPTADELIAPPLTIGDLLRYLAHVERTEAIERQIRARQRDLIRTLHRDPWYIGGPVTQRNTVAWCRCRHTESIARSRADRRAAAAMVGIVS